MRTHFDEQLALLVQSIGDMGQECSESLKFAAAFLQNREEEALRAVSQGEQRIDRLERQIERLCMELILCQQPVATDLRRISAAMKLITDLERIGDQAADITVIAGYLPHRTDCTVLQDMIRIATRMVQDSTEAYIRRDLSLAETVISRDDEIDDLFRSVRQELIRSITVSPEQGEYALDLLMIAKYLERIGDHAVNVAEWVIFAETGHHKTVQ